MERSLLEELREFTGRDEALQAIHRYHIYTPMYYRTNDAMHSRRVWRIVRFVGPYVSKRFSVFNQSRAEAEALVHDDPEILTGDEQAGNKAKMTQEQLAQLEKKELEAIDTLSRRFPATLGGFSYQELMRAALYRQTTESQLVQFADKFDGFGEALHEIMAGNLRFAVPVTTEYGELGTPPLFYVEYFCGFAKKYPCLAFLTEGPEKLVELGESSSMNWEGLAKTRTPHTLETLSKPTNLQPYDLWKEILLSDGDEHEIYHLTTKTE